MFWWREKVRHHNLYCFFVVVFICENMKKKSGEFFKMCGTVVYYSRECLFCSGFSFSYVKPTFFQVIYFFHIWNRFFFRRKHFSSTKPNKWSFRRENFFFFMCETEKIWVFRRKTFSCALLCLSLYVTYAVNSRTLF